MTEAELVKLYNEFVDGYKQPEEEYYKDFKHSKSRRDRYIALKNKVKLMRIRLICGGVIDKKSDREFLEDLILVERNGVADAGNGTIDENDFINLIPDIKFLELLEEVIKNPCGDRGEDLLHYMRSICGINQFLIVNRIIAASTEDTSSTVKVKDFSYFFEKFQNRAAKNVIKKYHGIDDKSKTVATWYEKNVHVIKELRILIKKEINAEPDPTALSKLPWLWIEKNPNPNR